MCMIKKIANSIAKLFHKPIKQKVLVKFFSNDEFIEDYAIDGIYYATWRYPGWKPGNFPLKLMDDGTGIILTEGLVGTGKPYSGFSWKLA